eukprot:Seg3395.2 transcript_id=Seg3395.2/GoldUCD/mRNA.D3Y31 product="hypothetical protein" protein_id=Seg3395.2/GoldUCD/D3Y31
MIESKSRYTVSQFYVIEGSGGNLLSGKTAHELTLIQLVHKVDEKQTSDSKSEITTDHKEATEKKTNIPASTDGNIQRLLNKYRNVFEGEGKLKGQREMSVLKHAILDMKSSTSPRKTDESFKPNAFSKRKTTRLGHGFASTQADSGMGSLNSTPKPILIVSPIIVVPNYRMTSNAVLLF